MKDKDEDESEDEGEDVRREGIFGARRHWRIYHGCIIGSNLI